MRLLTVFVVALHFLGAGVAFGQQPPDSLKGEFLFYSQGRAYVRCDASAGPDDSVWCDALGQVLRASAPIWEFTPDRKTKWNQGDPITILRLTLPRRAPDVSLFGGYDAWDPVQMRTSSAWALWPLFHRTLFKVTPEGQVLGDLARSWTWRGFDLVVVVDTSVRFGDGAAVDAYTVKVSLERYLWYERDVPEFSWQYSIAGVESYRKGRTSGVVGLIPRGRDTLQFNMTRPNFSLPERLASPATAIVRWSRLPDEAPVTATTGYYGSVSPGEAADVFKGRANHRGTLVISHQVADRVWIGREDQLPCTQVRIPAPRLVVLRPLKSLPDGMLSFLHWAIDREASASDKEGGRSYYGGSLPVWWAGERPRAPFTFDYARAQAARRLVPGRPSLAIAFARGLEEEAQYLVTALKAWDVRASFASAPSAADVRLELWDFESFTPDAQIERAFAHAGLTSSDSLLSLLQTARSTADELKRSAMYRSLRSRLDDRNLYVVMLQHDALVTACGGEPLECTRDQWGRYVGPFFPAAGHE